MLLNWKNSCLKNRRNSGFFKIVWVIKISDGYFCGQITHPHSKWGVAGFFEIDGEDVAVFSDENLVITKCDNRSWIAESELMKSFNDLHE